MTGFSSHHKANANCLSGTVQRLIVTEIQTKTERFDCKTFFLTQCVSTLGSRPHTRSSRIQMAMPEMSIIDFKKSPNENIFSGY